MGVPRTKQPPPNPQYGKKEADKRAKYKEEKELARVTLLARKIAYLRTRNSGHMEAPPPPKSRQLLPNTKLHKDNGGG